jgi:hypothetical protein
MTKIDKIEALQRTKTMLKREWGLSDEPTSDANLRASPPGGLGQNDNEIRALETPIEAVDFADVDAQVTGFALVAAQIVSDLRDIIWAGIPTAHKT